MSSYESESYTHERYKRSRRYETWQTNLQENGTKIEQYVISMELFHENFSLQFKHKHGDISGMNASICSFELHDNNTGDIRAYSHALYNIETDGQFTGNLVGAGRGVGSDIGNRTGHFMFLLQILLAIVTNVSDFRLENFTDNPARAAVGIYRLLTPDFRTHYDEGFNGNLSLEEILHITEGSMRLMRGRDDPERWTHEMNNLLHKLECNGLPWNFELGREGHLENINKIPFLSIRGGSKKHRKSSHNKY